MSFGEKLIKLRKERGFSQEELGNKLEVARQTISKWELGETTPEMDKIIKIGEIFDISLDELLKNIDIKNSINNTNTQKLAGILILVIKIFGIIIVVSILISIISVIIFSSVKTEIKTIENHEIENREVI